MVKPPRVYGGSQGNTADRIGPKVNLAQRERPKTDDRLIRDPRRLPMNIRLIDSRDEGTARVVSRQEAIRLREESGLDIVVINDRGDMPVMKLVDYGRFKFEEQKQAREKHKRQHEANRGVKEFQFSLVISDHDYATKIAQIKDALSKNYDVRVLVKMNRQNKMALPRGKNMFDVSRNEDFVIRRVLADLASLIHPTSLRVSDGGAMADLKGLVAT